jgi:hypothetical protein
MSPTPASQTVSQLTEFHAHLRLFELTFKGLRKGATLLVEAFAADEQLLAAGGVDVIAMSMRAKAAASAVQRSDSIQYLQAYRKLGAALVTVLNDDYKTKRTVSVSVPTKYPIGEVTR